MARKAPTSSSTWPTGSRRPFVYAGIDVEAHGLLSGSRGRQIAARFATIETQPFAYGTRVQREHWAALVMSLEQLLRLHRHRCGALLDCAEYLYQRTGGMIGSLSHLVREAAILAILDGTEAITKATLDDIALDHAAEQHQTPTRSPRAAPAGANVVA